MWYAVKDKCYVDKPETIDALKDNIREAIGKIQLHTIDNVLKNWTDRVCYCIASRGLFSIINGKDCNLRKYSVVFFKAFSKKKVFGGPYIMNRFQIYHKTHRRYLCID